MQHERMGDGGYVPSLREYASRFGVTHERLRPGQRVMHAGPINRGVELSGALADDPATLIERQAANGLVVRMAILYDLLAEPSAAGIAEGVELADAVAA
jgi:aspartate carbamoyltransferase catalytic subunit